MVMSFAAAAAGKTMRAQASRRCIDNVVAYSHSSFAAFRLKCHDHHHDPSRR